MKFQILNNEELGFFDDNGNKTATIKISGSNDKLLPASEDAKIIKNGAHFMIVDRVDEVSKVINDALKTIK